MCTLVLSQAYTLNGDTMLLQITDWTFAEVYHHEHFVHRIVLRSDNNTKEVTYVEIIRMEERFRVELEGPTLDRHAVGDADLGNALAQAHFDEHAIGVLIVAFLVPVTQQSGWDMDFTLGEGKFSLLRSSRFPTQTSFHPPVSW